MLFHNALGEEFNRILKNFQNDSKNIPYKICLRMRYPPFFQNEKNDKKKKNGKHTLCYFLPIWKKDDKRNK